MHVSFNMKCDPYINSCMYRFVIILAKVIYTHGVTTFYKKSKSCFDSAPDYKTVFMIQTVMSDSRNNYAFDSFKYIYNNHRTRLMSTYENQEVCIQSTA